MSSHLKEEPNHSQGSTPQKKYTYVQDLKTKRIKKHANSTVKPILKKNYEDLYIHENIEWNADKRFFRDPIINQKVINARKEYIQKVKEQAAKGKNT